MPNWSACLCAERCLTKPTRRYGDSHQAGRRMRCSVSVRISWCGCRANPEGLRPSPRKGDGCHCWDHNCRFRCQRSWPSSDLTMTTLNAGLWSAGSKGSTLKVVGPDTPLDPARQHLARDLAAVLRSLEQAEVPQEAVSSPDLHWYRGDPLATMDKTTRDNIDRCRRLPDFGFDLDAAERIWDEAMKLPGAAERTTPRWYHGDLAAENLLVRRGALAAVLDFGGLSVGDPTVDLVVAWRFSMHPPGSSSATAGVDDATWLRGRAWHSA